MPDEAFQTTMVGSWPRPDWLLRELKRKNEGEATYDEFSAKADQAVLLALKGEEEAGLDIVTDGEQRRDSFYSFVADKFSGIKLLSVSELIDYAEEKAMYERMLRTLDVPAFAIKSPVAVGEIKRRRPLAGDELLFLKGHTRRKTKIPLPGPFMLTRASWVEPLTREAYRTREELASAYVRALREEIISLRDAGASFVQLDEPTLTEVVYGASNQTTFMCAAIMSKVNPREELTFATDLINEVTKGISGIKVGVHVCRGNWSRKDDALLAGDYSPLIPYFQQMKVDQLVLEFSTDRAGSMGVFEGTPDSKEIGLGVVNPRSDQVETAGQIVARAREATKYFDPSRICLNPDCGFATFAEVPLNAAETAKRKLTSMCQAAVELRRQYT
ncbi:MAG: cobalamin-independent methionine synthase II family protein [Nitrososphaerota archaeon]|nr:cobalamin-independent methionine synthase II family protein [Nitrososphaerota archaeon]MDG6938323.1 cobalamin-independent methionine synthase II family protein [Nitrososphaerota archaeon]MDG6959787.1 cobalamin-independent methionine synthase II family protein [Nitrososphaerota archaeon]MDG6969051.1 cobalamin-independent methionine synthase II family protein [Nitrososphaerota archaeon]MDG6972069.1 cobalamin-independent methionine synthase II family protein [Nitrososphaerota archaeon]